METKPSSRSKRVGEELAAVAGNGLLDRRAFLRGGAAFAAAMTGYTFVQSAAAEPLADDPWSKVPGNLVPAYGVPSRFEKNVVRTLSNPKGEPRTQHGRTPHHLLNGTITPNGLHFVIARGGETEVASFEAGEFRVDLEGRRVHARGNEVRLTPKEFELFVYMARHPNRVISHRTLLEAVWGEASQEQPEYLRVFMGQLRKKLEPDPSNPRYLVTEPWVGYRFNPNG